MSTDKSRDSADKRPGQRAHPLVLPNLGSTAQFFEGNLKMLPGVHVPLRSMLVTTGTDRILISPVGTDEEARAAIGVTTLVSPSLLHHIHLQAAIERMRPLAVWGPPGLAEKLPQFAQAKVFGTHVWPHSEVLEPLVIQGLPKVNLVAFLYRPSRTLYLADMVFNIQRPEGALTPITYRLMGIHKRFAVPRIVRKWVKDRKAFDRSIERLLAWDFDRIVMAHGDVVDTGGKAMLVNALRDQKLL